MILVFVGDLSCVEQNFFYWHISIKFGLGKYDFYLYKWLFTEKMTQIRQIKRRKNKKNENRP
jgi:hypothetical protein